VSDRGGIECSGTTAMRRAGEKFADSDLLGLPLRNCDSEKTLTAGKLECVERSTGHTTHKSLPELIGHLTA